MNEAEILRNAGIKPTSARILILRTMLRSTRPLSMAEIGDALETVDKSVISRTLSAFKDGHLIHVLDDGSDSTRYELCTGTGNGTDNDTHVHFHCERCGRTFCLEDLHIPDVPLPDGFQASFTNYMIKGLCPDCKK